jgi:Tfp pilus assembly protein PilF
MPLLRLLGFWIVGPLSLLGWWIGWRRRILPGWMLVTIPVYMIGVIAFFVTARYRAPLLPFLLICAALAILELMATRRPFWDRRRLQYLAALVILGIFVNANLWGAYRENPAHSYLCLGRAYMKLDRNAEARQAFENALKADSLAPRAHLNLGVIHYLNHDTAAAEGEYRRELEFHPTEAKAYNNLAVLRYEAGDYPQASELYRKALDLEPYYEDARLNLAGSLFQEGLKAATAGDLSRAADLFNKAVILDENQAAYRYNYALALGRLGYAAAAQEQLEAALRLAPDLQVARDLLDKLKALIAENARPPGP